MISKLRLAIILTSLIFILVARILEYIYWDNNKKENFTPYLNSLVRPEIRNIEKKVESFTNNTNGFFRKMIRKSGLYY